MANKTIKQKQKSGSYVLHEVTTGRDPICNMRLPIVGTLYVTGNYQWSGSHLQHDVTNVRDPICNMRLSMVGTLYAT